MVQAYSGQMTSEEQAWWGPGATNKAPGLGAQATAYMALPKGQDKMQATNSTSRNREVLRDHKAYAAQ